jgi:hypothetical protein
MENENKEKIILTDEELQEVAGGKKISELGWVQQAITLCAAQAPATKCMANPHCAWIGNKCKPDHNLYEH